MTPGEYLARRRAAAGLTIADVAQRIGTEPRIAERDRAELIARIEDDTVSPTIITLSALRRVYPFDVAVLARLAAPPAEASGPAPRLCRACACSELDACVGRDGTGCWWAEADLCIACAPGRLGHLNFAQPEESVR